MKKIFFLLLMPMTITIVVNATEENGCVEEIAAETEELILTKAKHLELFIEMKKLSKELDDTIDILNYKVISSMDEGLSMQESSQQLESAGNTVTSLVNTEGITAKVRLVYLRAAILRFQFYASKFNAEKIKEFNAEK